MSALETTREKPQHAPMDQFPVVDNCLQIGSRPVTELAAEMGDAPFYAYDSAVMSARVENLRAALPAGLHLHYAMKANPLPAVVQHMADRIGRGKVQNDQ